MTDWDEHLIDRARSADREERDAAWREVFGRMRGQVFALCCNLIGDWAEAEDAVQEVFVAAHDGLPRFRGDSRLSTWIYRIAIRVASQHRARMGRRRAEQLSVEPASSPDPDPVESRELREGLLEAMSALSIEQRVVLTLFSLEGLEHAEIARVLGVPIGTVWSRLHSARKRLMTLLGPVQDSTSRGPGAGPANPTGQTSGAP